MLVTGVSSSLARTESFVESVRLIADIGYKTIEIWMEQIADSGVELPEIVNLLKRRGLSYRFHSDTRDVNLTSSNIGVRRESIRQVLREIDIVAKLRGRVLTVHPGRMSSSKDIPEDFLDRQFDAMNEISKYAERNDVLIGVENMENRSKELVVRYEDLERLLDALPYPSVGMTFDIAHCESVEKPEEFLDKIKVGIVNVHVSQAVGGKMHAPLYREESGGIDYAGLLPRLREKYDGPLIIEGFMRGDIAAHLRNSFSFMENLLAT